MMPVSGEFIAARQNTSGSSFFAAAASISATFSQPLISACL